MYFITTKRMQEVFMKKYFGVGNIGGGNVGGGYVGGGNDVSKFPIFKSN